MRREIPYKELDKHFTAPAVVSPFYGDAKIPRKLKKKVKKWCGVHWGGLSNGERLWCFLESHNINYRSFLIKKVCENDGKR